MLFFEEFTSPSASMGTMKAQSKTNHLCLDPENHEGANGRCLEYIRPNGTDRKKEGNTRNGNQGWKPWRIDAGEMGSGEAQVKPVLE